MKAPSTINYELDKKDPAEWAGLAIEHESPQTRRLETTIEFRAEVTESA